MSERQFEFRVVAGSLKGRVIHTPDLGITRPPLTRLRKAVFDFLNPYLQNAAYLDLFSGSGSYLFEAVSRGADLCRGVEVNDRLAAAINREAERLKIDRKLFCYCENVFAALPRLEAEGRRFDIVMIAPPQYQGLIDRTLSALAEHTLTAEKALILCQHDSSETKDIEFGAFETLQQLKYGNTTYTVLTA